jgi:hypothetical protein
VLHVERSYLSCIVHTEDETEDGVERVRMRCTKAVDRPSALQSLVNLGHKLIILRLHRNLEVRSRMSLWQYCIAQSCPAQAEQNIGCGFQADL